MNHYNERIVIDANHQFEIIFSLHHGGAFGVISNIRGGFAPWGSDGWRAISAAVKNVNQICKDKAQPIKDLCSHFYGNPIYDLEVAIISVIARKQFQIHSALKFIPMGDVA